MTRRVTLTLGEFGMKALGEHARATTLSPDEFLDRAVGYYLSECNSQRPSRKPPAFLGSGSRGSVIMLDLDLGDSSWDALDRIAENERVPLEHVLQHALLLLIADLESGRVARWVLEESTRSLADGP
jgi:hypothetical protein